MNGLYSILKPPGSHTPGGFFYYYKKGRFTVRLIIFRLFIKPVHIFC